MYVRSVRIIDQREKCGFPFHLDIFKNFDSLEFPNNVTFLVGENGSGKSTLLEALAINCRATAIGSNDLNHDVTLNHVRDFAGKIRVAKQRFPKRTVFFRAEDAFGFTKRMINMGNELQNMEYEIENEYSNPEHRRRAAGVIRGQRFGLAQTYGENPDSKSHGETFLDILQKRIQPKGLYLLDEPETPLSPLRQIALLHMIFDLIKQDCQFIIATHSPILMGFPGADIYVFEEGKIKLTDYRDVEHVYITKIFIDNPKSLLQQD